MKTANFSSTDSNPVVSMADKALWQILDEQDDLPRPLGPNVWGELLRVIADELDAQKIQFGWFESGDVEQWLEGEIQKADEAYLLDFSEMFRYE